MSEVYRNNTENLSAEPTIDRALMIWIARAIRGLFDQKSNSFPNPLYPQVDRLNRDLILKGAPKNWRKPSMADRTVLVKAFARVLVNFPDNADLSETFTVWDDDTVTYATGENSNTPSKLTYVSARDAERLQVYLRNRVLK